MYYYVVVTLALRAIGCKVSDGWCNIDLISFGLLMLVSHVVYVVHVLVLLLRLRVAVVLMVLSICVPWWCLGMIYG